MTKVYLGLGSNLGDKESNLHLSIEKIKERIGKVISLSAFYASEPWGFESDNSFLNAAVCVETVLSPLVLLEEIQKIEKEMGRTKKSTGGIYSDRLIDIDILFYGNLIIRSEKLSVPHPLIKERSFVIIPLNEIAPELIDPETGKTIRTLCNEISL